jgi:hypothetical protein
MVSQNKNKLVKVEVRLMPGKNEDGECVCEYPHNTQNTLKNKITGYLFSLKLDKHLLNYGTQRVKWVCSKQTEIPDTKKLSIFLDHAGPRCSHSHNCQQFIGKIMFVYHEKSLQPEAGKAEQDPVCLGEVWTHA